MNLPDKIEITGQTTPDPDVCVFTVDRPLFPGDSFNCSSVEMAAGSPLLEALFALRGIRQLWVAENRLTVEKDSAEPWPILGKRVAKVVRDLIHSGQAPLVAPASRRSGLEEHIRKQVHRILEVEINPSIAAHGGRADLVGVKGTEVSLRLSGGCQGCSSAQVTLQQGIQRALFEQVPEVTDIIDVTNHAAGENPYYSGGEGESPLA